VSFAIDPLRSRAGALLDPYDAVSLEEVQADAALSTRVDHKYVVDWATFEAVSTALAGTHRALEIDGRRSFAYETVYFDSPTLGAYRAHMQQRRRRYKVRSRRYVDSAVQYFEVKLKGARGETVKHQLPCRLEDHGHVSAAARAFLSERLAEAYPSMGVPELGPTIHTNYNRMTLAHDEERLTADFNLSFSDGISDIPGLSPEYLIVESKSVHGLATADRELRRLGIRPLSCSKYCVGMGLLRDDVKVNELRWLLGRYFNVEQRPGLPAQGGLDG